MGFETYKLSVPLSTQNSHVEALPTSMAVFRDEISKEVIKIK